MLGHAEDTLYTSLHGVKVGEQKVASCQYLFDDFG